MAESKAMRYRPLSLVIGTGVTGGRKRFRPPYFRTKKLALIGATQSVQYAPWGDTSWTFAAHPCARRQCRREPDWYFDMHRPECFEVKNKGWNEDYYQWLKNLQTPIFMQQDADHAPGTQWDIPMAVRYPIEQIKYEFRSALTGRLFATNHTVYMIALALTEGVREIGLFGCQYQGLDRGAQRESLIYWIGRCEERGVRVVTPDEYNTLLHPRELYGYESHDDKGKLIGPYKPPVQTTVKAQDAEGKTLLAEAKVIDSEKAEGRPPLMQPPDGVDIAWERSGLLVKDDGERILVGAR